MTGLIFERVDRAMSKFAKRIVLRGPAKTAREARLAKRKLMFAAAKAAQNQLQTAGTYDDELERREELLKQYEAA